MAGLNVFAKIVQLLVVFGFLFLENVFADGYDTECYSFECGDMEYCCGYHYCCTDYTRVWYIWLLLICFIIGIISLITCCCVRRRRAGLVVRGGVITQNPGTTTYTTTTVQAPEQQQPIFYGTAQATYGATAGYQNPYQPQVQQPYFAAAPPAYQPQETKGPSAPQFTQ